MLRVTSPSPLREDSTNATERKSAGAAASAEKSDDEMEEDPAVAAVNTDKGLEVEPEKEKPAQEGASADGDEEMDVPDPAAAPVFDPAIMVVPEGADWDEMAEVAAGQVGLPRKLPDAKDHLRVIARSIFYSGQRRCWVAQTTTDRAFVALTSFPHPSLIQGRSLAERYATWVRVALAHPELEMQSAYDLGIMEKSVVRMLSEIPSGAENIDGARNRLDHWFEVVVNQSRREQRELQKKKEEEARLRRDQERVDQRHRLLHGRNAALGRQDEDDREKRVKTSQFPSFMRGLEPIEEEIDSLEKATGHYKLQLGELANKPMVKEAKRGQAFLWPARHSDPMSVASCCRRCGGDLHIAGAKCAFDEVKEDAKLRRATDLPEDAKAEEEDNVYVAMVLADQSAGADKRCEYELCGERSTHNTAACPVLHARCQQCQFRGHREDTKVDGKAVCTRAKGEKSFTYRTTGLLGVAFERAADKGRFTKHRRAFPAAGFYPCIGRVEEGLLANIGYEVVFRVGASRTQTYLDGCRKAAKDAFGMHLVQEVVGTRYEMSREQEMAEYDELVTEYARSYAGVIERAVRKAELRVLQVEELVKVMRRVKDQRDITRASAHLAKVKEDVWSLANQLVGFRTHDASVITGIEPVNRVVAIAALSPKVREIFLEREDEKAMMRQRQEAVAAIAMPPSPGGQGPSYAGATLKRVSPSATYTPSAAASTSHPSTAGASRVQVRSRLGPSPDRKRSKRQEMAVALKEAYRAHERYEAGGARPTEAVSGIMTVSEFRRMSRAGHHLMQTMDPSVFYTRRGQLPKLSDEDLDRLPKSMKRIPVGSAWRETDFRHGDVWQIANRFFYIRNAYGELEFDPQNPRLPEVIKRPLAARLGSRPYSREGEDGRHRSSSGSGGRYHR